jgi:mRNA interferase RelE/StbE
MAKYNVEFTRSAEKEFDKLSAKLKVRVVDALTLLAENPYSELLRIKKLRGMADLYRIRLGDYRLLYEVIDDRLVVLVIKIGNRRDVYRGR